MADVIEPSDKSWADILTFPNLVDLGRYQLVYPLGRGSHGVVYEAFDCHLERHVAVKIFTGWESMEDIEREAFYLARVDHPNVIVVHDLCIEPVSNLVYLVMELVMGATLRQRASESDDWRELLGWYVQVARGLHAIHDEQLVHGDIKPSNILVDHRGRARIIDFSLCCARGEVVRGGTPRYQPPERAEDSRADPSGDQYSFAASIVASLSSLRPALEAPRLVEVLERAMAMDPANRFTSMAELSDELEWVQQTGASVLGSLRGWFTRMRNSDRGGEHARA